MRSIASLFLAICCLYTNFSSATLLKGKVANGNNHAMPFAVITVDTTELTATTNEKGYYEIDVPAGTYEIWCEAIGYSIESERITIGTEPVTLNFRLNEQVYNIGEVIIRPDGEDPAIYKMREVIKKRKYHEELVKSLETEIYVKGILKTDKAPDKLFGQAISDSDKVEMGLDSAGKGILYLLEQVTQYYYQAPNKVYNHVKSVRTSGDAQGLGFASVPPIINIYENNVQIMSGLNERGFISPANSNAFWYYDYKLEGTFVDENKKLISKIKVIPKRKYEPLFYGYVYVIEDEWVFKTVDLTLTKLSGIDLLDTLNLQQNYTPYGQDIWIIKNQNIIPYMNLLGFGFNGSFITNYKNQKVNQAIDPNIFSGRFLSTYDKDALKKSKEYWDSTRLIPLTKEEVTDFVKKDSMEIAYKDRDSLDNRKTHFSFNPINIIASGMSIRKNNLNLSINPLITMISFNSVEGLSLTLNPTFRWNKDANNAFTFYGITRYGFSSETWYNVGGISYRYADSKREARSWFARIEGGIYITDITGLEPITPLYNAFSTLFYGKNYLKFYERSYVNINLSRNFGNGLQIGVRGTYEDRNPLENTTTYTFNKSKEHNISPNNPGELPIFLPHRAAVISAQLSYQPGWKYIQYPDRVAVVSSRAPVFSLSYIKGIPGLLNSNVDFDKWQLEIYHQLRMKLLGSLQYRLVTGGFLNKESVGNPDYNHYTGNQIALASTYLNSFQIAPYYRFSNTADWFFRGHLEWHLGGLLSNKIPLFRQLNWHFVGGTNTLFINKDDYYSEIFFGVENIGFKMFRFGRVDFVFGYESGKAKPNFGVRIGFNSALMRM